MFRIGATVLLMVVVAASGVSVTAPKRAAQRAVAITFDDLPVASTAQDDATWSEITRKLLRTMTTNHVPIVGFVNEGKLYSADQLNQFRVDLLRKWLDAGLELGNHTFSHRSLNTTPLNEFEQDFLRGEPVTRDLLKARGMKLRYFRHPFLQTGRTLEKRQQFEAFLAAHGYTIAPVTIDNSDWIFARAYDHAREANDAAAMKQIGAAYIPYMESKFAYYETESNKLFGRQINQVLLLHANSINADYFGELVTMLRKRGYSFIKLEQALTDEAYKSPDTFTGSGGISWLDRWALTRPVPAGFFKGEPRTPAFVMQLAGVDSE